MGETPFHSEDATVDGQNAAPVGMGQTTYQPVPGMEFAHR